MNLAAMNLAALNHRFASLLEAGLSTNEASEQLAGVRSALPKLQQEQFDRLLSFGRELGIPLVDLLRESALQVEQKLEQARQLESAFAGPKSTAYLVAGLPALSLAMAQLAGLRPLDALANNLVAQIAFVVGFFLLVGGWLVMKKLLERAKPSSHDPGELFGIFAQSLLSGLPTQVCFEASCRQVKFGVPESDVPTSAEPNVTLATQVEECTRLMEFSQSSGSSLRKLLIAEATARRSEDFSKQRAAIEKLSVRLMIPLGLVVLPAFVLIGIVPVAVGMLTNR